MWGAISPIMVQEVKEKVDEFITHFQGENRQRDDLIAFYYKLLRELEFCDKCIENAEASDEPSLTEFFREVQAQDRLRAWRTEELLRRYLN
jgi:hypothetical protein